MISTEEDFYMNLVFQPTLVRQWGCDGKGWDQAESKLRAWKGWVYSLLPV